MKSTRDMLPSEQGKQTYANKHMQRHRRFAEAEYPAQQRCIYSVAHFVFCF